MKSLRKVLASLRKADELFSLIDEKDVICLGISGGKDSLCLWKAMSLYRLFSHKDFSIVPICLDLGFPGFDPSGLEKFGEEIGTPLYVESAKDVYPILEAHTEPNGHIPCSICSRMKKAAINAAAKSHHCNKVAFAHHKDDAVETLFMNMIHGGRVATFEPKMRLDRAGITFIRPLILASEEDLRAMAKEESLPVMGKICPADGFTEREWTKNLLAKIYEERPEAKANLASMLYNYEDFVLYFSHLEFKTNDGCALSLKPLISAEEAISYERFASKHGFPLLEKGKKHLLCLKNHRCVGAISFQKEIAHQIDILACSILGSQEESASFLSNFMERFAKEENPIEFRYVGKGKKKLFQYLGYEEKAKDGKTYLTKKVMR